MHEAINNGVIVLLNSGASWTVTGASYITKLVVAADASVVAPSGGAVSMTVDGVSATIVPGNTYSGAITLMV